MMVNLTRSAIAMIMDGDEDLKPVLQVYNVTGINYCWSNTVRYELKLSDGSQLQEAMIPTQMNGMIDSGRLRKGSIVRLIKFIVPFIQNRKLIAVINLEIIAEKCDIIPVLTPDNNAGNLQSCNGSLPDGPVPAQTLIHRYQRPSPDHLQVMNDADAANVAAGRPKPHVDNAVNVSIDLNRIGSAPVVPSRFNQPWKVGEVLFYDLNPELVHLSSGVIPWLSNGSRPEMPILQIIDLFDSVYDDYRMFISDGSHMRLAVIPPRLNFLINGMIIRLICYDFIIIAKQRTIILKNLEILANNCKFIGQPKIYSEVAYDGSITVNGSDPLGPRPSSPTTDVQEYLDATHGNDHYQPQDQHLPFQLGGIPTTENLPSGCIESAKINISKPYNCFQSQIQLPACPDQTVKYQFPKPYQMQQNQSFKESFLEMYPTLHQDLLGIDVDVSTGRLFPRDLEMKREKDNHQAEVARLHAHMDRQHEDYQNQIYKLGKKLQAAKKIANATPKVKSRETFHFF